MGETWRASRSGVRALATRGQKRARSFHKLVASLDVFVRLVHILVHIIHCISQLYETNHASAHARPGFTFERRAHSALVVTTRLLSGVKQTEITSAEHLSNRANVGSYNLGSYRRNRAAILVPRIAL